MCNEIMQEFADFMHTAAKSEHESFSIQDDRLDTVLPSRMIVMHPKHWSVIDGTAFVARTGLSGKRIFSR